MKINWNYIKAFLLIGLVIFLFSFANIKNEQKKVKDISINFKGKTPLYVSYQTVNKLLIQNGESIKKLSKSMLDLHKLEKRVLSHPMIEDAAVFLTVDGVLKTNITQRTPMARVITDSSSFYIDKQAKKMPLSKNYAARVIIVKGNINNKSIKEIHRLVQKINADVFLKKQITAVKILPQKEFMLEVREGNHKILLGNLNNLSHKLQNLKAFYKKTLLDSTIKSYKTINLKYQNQVVCTKK